MNKTNKTIIKEHLPGIVIAILIVAVSLYYSKNISTGYIGDVPNTKLVLIKAYDYKDKSLIPTHKEAISYYKKGEYEKAARIFERMLINSPNEPSIHFGLGAMQMFLKDLHGAEVSFNSVLKLAPNTAPAIAGLANIAGWRKDNRKSIKLYKKALSIRPNFVTSHYDIALQYHLVKEYDLAKKHYLKVIKLIPNSQYARNSKKRLAKLNHLE